VDTGQLDSMSIHFDWSFINGYLYLCHQKGVPRCQEEQKENLLENPASLVFL
jgi:hypothetical protein